MRFGGTNVYVERCKMYGPGKYCFRGSLTKQEKANSAPSELGEHRNNMLSIFTYYSDFSMPIPALPGNILITDCEFENADRFLHFNFSGNETWQRYRPLDSIEFRNIEAKDIRMPINLYGKKGEEVSLRLSNVNVEINEIMENKALINACNYSNIVIEGLNVSGKLEAIVKKWSEGNIILKNINAETDCDTVEATEVFFTPKV